MANQDGLVYDLGMARRKTKGTCGGWRPGSGRKPELDDPARFTVDVERRDLDAVKAIAERRGVSAGQVVREAVAAFLRRKKR